MARDDIFNIQLGLIQIKKSTYDILKARTGKEDISPLLASWCAKYLNELAQGAMLIPAAKLQAHESTVGKTYTTPEDLLKDAQSIQCRTEGRYQFVFDLDPALNEALERTAEWRSSTPKDVLEECANSVVVNGWAENWEGAFGMKPVSALAQRVFEELTGKKNFSLDDVAKTVETFAVEHK